MEFQQGQPVRISGNSLDVSARGHRATIRSVAERNVSIGDSPGQVISYWVVVDTGRVDIVEATDLEPIPG